MGIDSHEATEGLQRLAASLEESGDLTGAAGEFERIVRAAGSVNPGYGAVQRNELTHAISVLERNGGQPLVGARYAGLAQDQPGPPEEALR